MDNFEEQLKRAMTESDPSPDFAAKVMEKVAVKADAAAKSRAASGVGSPPWWQMFFLPAGFLHARNTALAGGLAAVMIVGTATAYQAHLHQQQVDQQRAEAARDQLMVALRITSTQLHHVSHVLAPQER